MCELLKSSPCASGKGSPPGDGVKVTSGGPGAAGTDANRDFLYLSHRWLPLVFLHPAMNWW